MADNDRSKTRSRTWAIRARMAATGETYVVAARRYDAERAERIAEIAAAAAPPPPPRAIHIINSSALAAAYAAAQRTTVIIQANYQALRQQMVTPPPDTATPVPGSTPSAARAVGRTIVAAHAVHQSRRRGAPAPPAIFSSAPTTSPDGTLPARPVE